MLEAYHNACDSFQPAHSLAERLHRVRCYVATYYLHDCIFALNFGIANYINFHDAIYAAVRASIARIMIHPVCADCATDPFLELELIAVS